VSLLFCLSDLGSSGLRRWFRLFSFALFKRAIEPVAEVANGAEGNFPSDCPLLWRREVPPDRGHHPGRYELSLLTPLSLLIAFKWKNPRVDLDASTSVYRVVDRFCATASRVPH